MVEQPPLVCCPWQRPGHRAAAPGARCRGGAGRAGAGSPGQLCGGAGAGRPWAGALSTLRVCHSCGEAFAGQRCQAHSPCLSAPCKNAGTCHVLERGGVLDYTCSCRLGFSGPLCLTPWDNACLASPCRNGGTCDLLTLTEYKCRCPPGWSGEDRGRAAAWPCPRARGVPGFPWPAGGLWSRSSSGRLPEGPQAPPRGPCPSPSLPLGKGDTLIYAAGGAGYWSTVFKSRALQTDRLGTPFPHGVRPGMAPQNLGPCWQESGVLQRGPEG